MQKEEFGATQIKNERGGNMRKRIIVSIAVMVLMLTISSSALAVLMECANVTGECGETEHTLVWNPGQIEIKYRPCYEHQDCRVKEVFTAKYWKCSRCGYMFFENYFLDKFYHQNILLQGGQPFQGIIFSNPAGD